MIQKYKTVGYFETKKQALDALASYNACPYDLDAKNMTFNDVYEAWSEEYFKTLESKTSERTVTSAYKYAFTLYNVPIRDIRVYHLEEAIEKGYVIPEKGKDKGKKRYASANTKGRMKSLFNLMFDYAMKHEIVDKNYARMFHLSEEIQEQKEKDKKKRVPFTNKELELLWKNVDEVKFVDMILIGVYSGWRPQELAILKVADINWELGVM